MDGGPARNTRARTRAAAIVAEQQAATQAPALASSSPLSSLPNTTPSPPLPALAPRESRAYGSPGKVLLRDLVANEFSSFAADFTRVRGGSVPVDSSGVRARNGRAVAIQTIAEEEVPRPHPEWVGRASQAGSESPERYGLARRRGDSIAYQGAGPDSGIVEGVGQPSVENTRAFSAESTGARGAESTGSSSATSPPPHAQPVDEGEEPWGARVFMHTLPRWSRTLAYWYRVKAGILLGWLLVFFLALLLISEVGRSYQPPTEIMAWLPEWMQANLFHVPRDFMAINRRLRMLEIDTQLLKKDVRLMEKTTAAITDMLPSHLAVTEVNGRYEIPSFFWEALADRLKEGGSSDIWREFLDHNQHQLGLGHLAASFVPREEFVEIIKQHDSRLNKHQLVYLRQLKTDLLESMQEMAVSTTEEFVKQSPGHQLAVAHLDMLVKAVEVQNLHDSLTSVNIISRGLGAIVNPHLTSPTMQRPQPNVLAKVASKMPWYPAVHRPIVALERWEEAGDCWCAAPSDKRGQAQLGIIMPVTAYPENLIIEHVPPSGTFNIASAPKDVEVWAELDSPAMAHFITAVVKDEHGDATRYKCRGESPSQNHVCLGQVQYNQHATNWVQSYQLPVQLERYDAPVNNIVIRATTNWGADWTCIYRYRLTGKQVE